MSEIKKRILLTNGRSPMTLSCARLLHSAGHEVYITDAQKIHYCRFSNCVKKNFVVPSPRFKPNEHIKQLCKIVKDEKIDLLIPTWEDAFLIAKHKDKFDKRCKLFVTDFNLLMTLHNKWSFIKFIDQLGFETPKTQIIRSKEDLANIDMEHYVLKPGFSRSSTHVYKVDRGGKLPNVHPTEDEEWIAQEWLEGDIFCSYTLCHNGKIQAHSAYPMEFIRKQGKGENLSVGSYCLSFSSIRHERIFKWTEDFVKKTHFTGQIAFDFFELPSGKLYAIECNPRLTSGVTLFLPEDRIDKAFLGESKTPIHAREGAMTQVILGMLLLGWQPALVCNKLKLYFKKLLLAKDLVFSKKDIKPFLIHPLIGVKTIWLCLKTRSSIPASFTYDLDYNGEEKVKSEVSDLTTPPVADYSLKSIS